MNFENFKGPQEVIAYWWANNGHLSNQDKLTALVRLTYIVEHYRGKIWDLSDAALQRLLDSAMLKKVSK